MARAHQPHEEAPRRRAGADEEPRHIREDGVRARQSVPRPRRQQEVSYNNELTHPPICTFRISNWGSSKGGSNNERRAKSVPPARHSHGRILGDPVVVNRYASTNVSTAFSDH